MKARNCFAVSWALALLLLTPGFAQQSRRPRRSPPAATQAASQEAQDREAIQELYQAEIRANLSLDTDAMAGLFDDDIVIMEPGHAPLVGRDAAGQYLTELKTQFADDEILAYNQEWKEVRPLGDYTVQWGTISGRVRPTAGGDEISYTYDVMRVLKRQPSGSWKVFRWIWNSPESEKKVPAGEKELTPTEKPKKDGGESPKE